MTVIQFPGGKPPSKPDEKIVVVCPCGCMSFLLREDGEFECCSCATLVQMADFDGWRKRFPNPPEDVPEIADDAVKITDLNSSGAALRSVLALPTVKDTGVVIVIQNSGAIRTWGECYSPDQTEWLGRRLKVATDMIGGKKQQRDDP